MNQPHHDDLERRIAAHFLDARSTDTAQPASGAATNTIARFGMVAAVLLTVVGVSLVALGQSDEPTLTPAPPATNPAATQQTTAPTSSAPIDEVSLVIPAGGWVAEIVPEIASQLDWIAESDLQAALDSQSVIPAFRPPGQTSYEGAILAGTFTVQRSLDATAVLKLLVDESSARASTAGLNPIEYSGVSYSAYEVLIVASLVEAETPADDERANVASVIYNRLAGQWILGLDSTCVYAQGVQAGTGERVTNLTRSMLNDEGPYGCRTKTGLPPTPINSPGLASLEAALNPANTDYRYYVVADQDGRLTFAETEEEFQAAKLARCEAGLDC